MTQSSRNIVMEIRKVPADPKWSGRRDRERLSSADLDNVRIRKGKLQKTKRGQRVEWETV